MTLKNVYNMIVLLTAGGANGRTKRADETGRQSKEAAKFVVSFANKMGV